MKSVFTLTATLLLSLSLFAQIPYNPDSNSDGVINAGDLTGFLTVFGSDFFPEGIMPIQNGGTGVESLAEIKDTLNISLFSDSLWNIGGEISEYGWVEGGLRATGNVATGFDVEAIGDFSTAEGYSTTASGNFSHSQNRFTTASGICSHAEGEGGTASGTAAHAEGFGCFSTNIGSHAEGYQTTATQWASHAEGFQSDATAQYAHAEGRETLAAGTSSHSEGQNTSATGLASHAEGNFTVASAARSHAGGYYTVADQENQTSVGQFNQLNQMGVLFVVGNGTSQVARADAFKVLNDGNASLSGTLNVGGNVIVNEVDLLQTISDLEAANASLAQQLAELQALVNDLINN